MEILTQDTPLSEIVKDNFLAAALFEKYNLDFCCGGKTSLGEACKNEGVDIQTIFTELENLTPGKSSKENSFGEWGLDFLSEYIIHVHHTFVRKAIPPLLEHTKKISSVHKERHPELGRIADLFERVASELQQHMMKEEQILFPAITSMVDATRTGGDMESHRFMSIKHPIAMMEMEHQIAGDLLHEIKNLSDGYSVPADGCTTYQVAFKELQEFERDLHQHIHLENNILFPKAIAFEQMMLT